MKSRGNADFWALYRALPAHVRAQARHAYALFCDNPDHPGLRFKKLGGPHDLWSVRFGDGCRAVAQRTGDTVVWRWIGTHQAFDKLF